MLTVLNALQFCIWFANLVVSFFLNLASLGNSRESPPGSKALTSTICFVQQTKYNFFLVTCIKYELGMSVLLYSLGQRRYKMLAMPSLAFSMGFYMDLFVIANLWITEAQWGLKMCVQCRYYRISRDGTRSV
jgi:hypothetical protein